MRVLLAFILSLFCFQVPAQKLELIQNQWEAILSADDPKEKIMRSCRMNRSLNLSNYDFDQLRLVRDADLSQIEGMSDLIDEAGRFRLVSWYFEIEDGSIQYAFNSACAYADEAGYRFNMNACDNNHEINCRECDRGSGQNNNWKGTYYSEMNTFYEDSLLIVQLNGLRFHKGDTVKVTHYYSIAPKCQITLLKDSQNDAVR
jgi:hypothetical protein